MGGRGSSSPITGALTGRRASQLNLALTGLTKQQALYYATLAGVSGKFINEGDSLTVSKTGDTVSVNFSGKEAKLSATISVPRRDVRNNSFSGESTALAARNALQTRVLKKSTYELIG